MQIRSFSRSSSNVTHWYLVIHEPSNWLIMTNPLKTWFFELIEDAIGSKAMKQFKKEEEKKWNSKSKSHVKED